MINHHIFGQPIFRQSHSTIRMGQVLRILRHGSRSLFLKIHHHGSEYLESIQRSSVESCRVVFLWVSKLSSGKIEHDHHFPRGGRQCEDSSLDCIVCDGLKYVTPYLDRCNWRSNLVVVVVMMIDDWSWWQVCWWSMTIFLNPPVKSQHLSASSLRARFRPPFWWWNAVATWLQTRDDLRNTATTQFRWAMNAILLTSTLAESFRLYSHNILVATLCFRWFQWERNLGSESLSKFAFAASRLPKNISTSRFHLVLVLMDVKYILTILNILLKWCFKYQ